MPRYVTQQSMPKRRRCARGRGGPSDAQWELHKRTIIQLYKTGFLEDVRSEMERLHGFCATKRMYDTHFRKWGVSKIIKSSEKEEILQQMSQGPLALENSGIQLDPTALKKVMRYFRSQKRGDRQFEKNPASTHIPLEDYNSPELMDVKPPPGEGERDEIKPTSVRLLENLATPITNASGSFRTTSNSLSTTSQGSSRESRSPVIVSSPPMLEYCLANHSAYRVHERIIYLVRTYHSVRVDSLEPSACSGDVLSIGSTVLSRRFWSNIKNGIYLWKIRSSLTGFNDDQLHGFRALSEARVLADAMLRDEPLDFMCEVLSTLSPTNTSVHPPLRRHILTYLAEVATIRLGETHPLPLLCKTLRDDSDDAFVSRNALLALLDFFRDRLGPSHCSTSGIMNRLITQMRRSGDPPEVLCARQLAENAVQQAIETGGVESNETRKIAVELANILTKLGEHGRTLSLRMQVVTKTLKNGSETYREDGIAAHTMEDIAEYYVRFGFHQEGVEWLRRAKDIAVDVWGRDDVSTLHIIDKMEKLQRGDLSGQVVNK